MKKTFVFVILIAFVSILLADMMTDVPRNSATLEHGNRARVFENTSRDVPEWEFFTDPLSIMTNYYDYMPGSYNSTPVRLQPDDAGDGIYIAFHGRETAGSTRRVYYAYIDGSGNLTNVATISTDDIVEGYAGLDIDPVTGDPIVSWHVNIDPSSVDNECVVSYDMFHLGSPGLWKTPFVVIDESYISNDPADEFEWPYVYIGPSPTAGKRRVYVVGNNAYGAINPSENVLIAHADFDVNDFNMQSELDWTYNTIPLMDDWNAGNPEWQRPNKAMAVSEDGKVALFGYVITDGETSTTPDRMFCFVNDNYGDGDYTYFEGQAEFDIANPQNQDGTYRFVDPDTGQPKDLYMEPYLCNHQNVIFANGGTELKFLGNMNMMLHPASWYPDLPMMYPKVYTYDLVNEEFKFQDLYITGANPNDNVPMLPWDLDEDGQVDEYDPDGYVTWVEGWPIYHFDNGVAFHENNFKMTKNEDKGWLAAIWSEGLKSRLGNVPEPGYEDWAEFPEVAIAISNDGGLNWQDPIIFNAKSDDDNYAPEIDGMIPCYLYPGDEIEDLGDGYGLLHLAFLDDNSYGSFIQGHGENLGGTMMYSSIKIKFEEVGSNNNTIIPSIASISQNYPNPFNPTTTIKYNLNQASDVLIDVFNVKGQKVTTLVNENKQAGQHEAVWNGKDSNNRNVSSGVYFYKMRAGGRYTDTRKMILLK